MRPENSFEHHSNRPGSDQNTADDLLTVLNVDAKKDTAEQQKAALFRAWQAGEIGQSEYMQKVNDVDQMHAITYEPQAQKALDRINDDSPRRRFARRVLSLVHRS